MCKLKLIHNEKSKHCRFSLVQDGGPAVLGMPDIDKLSLISFNCETTHRQVTVDDSVDNNECESQIQIGGRKCKQFESEKQIAEAQSQHNADNTAKPTIVTNPMVTGSNNSNNDLVAETINNGSISFL